MSKMIDLLKEFAPLAKQWFYEEPEKRYELVKNNYQFFHSFFTKEKLEKASWEEFQQIGEHLHTLKTLPLAKKKAFGQPNHELSYYRQQFINLLDTATPLAVRIKHFKLNYFGANSLGELLGYLFPDNYSIFNQRSAEGLEILNIHTEEHRGEDFSEKFIHFNQTLTPLKKAYTEIVGSQTDLCLNLEIDQFLSWVQEHHANTGTPAFWGVGSIWQNNGGDQRNRFINNSIWECGYQKEGNLRYQKELNAVKKGDIFVLKTCATNGPGHKTPISIIKNIGIVQERHNEYTFQVQWLDIPELPYRLEGISLWNTIAPIQDSTALNLIKELMRKNENRKLIIPHTTPDFPLNQILYGPPGTGKTYHTVIKAMGIIDKQTYQSPSEAEYDALKERFDSLRAAGQITFITFHQNYSYEDFMVGIRPNLQDGQISYKLYEGPFKQIADKAKNDSANNYVLIIDEINRGNISKIFGELITLIEADKRYGNKHALSTPLLYHKDGETEFSVPNNLYIIGTMNTADKSIALVDIALRRRFVFEEMMPKAELLNPVEGFDLPGWFARLNQKITAELDRDHQIGHSYFMEVKTIDELQQKFYQCILPLLKEYFYGNPDKLKEIIPGFTTEEKLEGKSFINALQQNVETDTDERMG